jgi:PAS domain S-box-containing protein
MEEVLQFFKKLFDSSDWPPRWHCGNWTEFHGWLYILSDLLIWSAYFAIPVVIIRYISRKYDPRFIKLYFLFAAFILACGATHFLDALAFWIPVYRLSALVRFLTAVISWVTVFSLIRYLPVAFSLKTPHELETEIESRELVEREIKILNTELTKQANTKEYELSAYKYALDESSIVAITDQKGIINYVNDNFRKISKYNTAELIGQDHRIINSGFHPPEFIRNLWVTIANGKIWKGELKNKAKDGTIYWVDTTIVPFLNEDGKPYQYVAIRADITERKIAEENLEKSLKETSDYKYALEESSIVAITDQKGIIKYANDNFCRISKYSREELIGQDHRIINSGFHSKEFIRNLWATIANGKIWKGELKNKAKDGTIYWVDTTIVPFLNEQGKPYQYIAIRADITERKRVEQLIIANKELTFQSEEKEKRAAELIIANKELAFQNEEKEKRAAELVIANKELVFQSEEKEKRAAELVIANKELVFQSEEKEKRAAELVIANKELVFQNEEKEKRAAELVIANKELVFQSEEKEKRAAELVIANKELVFQSEEKEKRASELVIANKELVFQNDEKGKRAAELSETLERISFLASIADNIQDPVISTDIHSNITRWNKAAEILFEWQNEEVIGKTGNEILGVIYPHESREHILESLKTRGFWHGEVIYHTKSGQPLNVLITVSHLKDTERNITGNLLLVRDITERKKMEDELSALNINLEQKIKERTETLVKTLGEKNTILESIGDAFFAVDKNWTVTYWNRIAEIALGVPKQQIVGKYLWDVFSDSIDSLSYKKYHRAIATSQVVQFEDFYAALGKWYEISAYPSENGLSVYFKDISERKKAAEEIKELNEGLEKKVIERTRQFEVVNKELEAFSYSVSHDLRAPLRAISGYSRILAEDYEQILDNEGKRIIEAVVANSKRMGQLIDDLLNFSKMARMGVYLFTVDMRAKVQECIDELMHDLPVNLYDVKVDEALPKARVDPAMIKQVWMNLISNALKYSSKKEHPVIEIGYKREGAINVYFIRDNGAGFNMDYADKLFGVFQRLHSNEEFEGTGVGLALVNRIINKHNGKVWGEGKEGEGATFYFSLPCI